jgi:hypothetical protein
MSCAKFISRKVEGGGLPPLIFATPRASFKDLLGKIRSHGIHRVYVAEKSTHVPLGVVSCSDIIDMIAAVLEAPYTPIPQAVGQQGLMPGMGMGMGMGMPQTGVFGVGGGGVAGGAEGGGEEIVTFISIHTQ